jgi:hypothetical protein
MTRVLKLLLAAAAAATLALATPAMALNPQPLPPGFKSPYSHNGPSAFIVKQNSVQWGSRRR